MKDILLNLKVLECAIIPIERYNSAHSTAYFLKKKKLGQWRCLKIGRKLMIARIE